MVNNSSNINKANNQLSPQTTEHKKDHDILENPGHTLFYDRKTGTGYQRRYV